MSIGSFDDILGPDESLEEKEEELVKHINKTLKKVRKKDPKIKLKKWYPKRNLNGKNYSS